MSDKYDGLVYLDIDVGCATLTNPESGKETDCIVLDFESENQADIESKYLTIGAAKKLIQDMKDAVEACLKHQRGELPEVDE